MPGRLTIGLYNSYDPRRFSEAHRRALVRAAPLALAYDANLATFGFPFDDLAAHGGRTSENRSRGAAAPRGQGQGQGRRQAQGQAQAQGRGSRGKDEAEGEGPELRTPADIAEYLAATTSVAGAKGTSEGDISHFVQLAKAGRFHVFDLPKKGFPPQLGTVVLTTERALCPRDTSARAVARELVDGRSQLLVFGLGPHGTPAEVRDIAAWELDITGGQGIGLETATAMGAVVAAIAAHREALEGR